MPEFLINNIPIQFPFEPYDVQRAYMEKVIDSLQTGSHAMLESPTGTGKTLSLLCSTLGWLTVKKAQLQAMRTYSTDENSYVDGLKSMLNSATGTGPANEAQSWAISTPKIIYSSRTHSQLTQAISELKRTSYCHMRVAVLGSRDQLCTHPEVSKEESTSLKIAACQGLVKARACHLHRNIERKKDDKAFVEAGVMDIEDLITVSHKLRVCPYYMSRELKQMADIVFMPYNYLLDPRTRKQQDVDLNNSIVILDEGHNVEKMCEESSSYQITSTDIAICLSEVTEVMKAFADMPAMNDFNADSDSQSKDFTIEELMVMKSLLLELEKAIDDIQLTEKDKTERSFPGEYIFELLEKATITAGKKGPLLSMMEKLVLYLSTPGNSPFQRNGAGLEKLASFIKIVFNMEKKTFQEHFESVRACYKVFVTLEKNKNQKKKADTWLKSHENDGKRDGKVVNFWCFHPGFGMKSLLDQGVHSIIVTSGTLSPLAPLISELGIPINITLENGHVIDKEQVYVSVVRQGPDGVQLNSSFKNREDPAYLSSLGRTILNFSRIIPEGLLVFFPSYPVLNKCKEHWQLEGIWSQICAIKEIFVEPQGKRELKEVMSGYYSRIAQPGSKGACFLAVCRGKVSEGLDFADYNGRAVILTGLPYPPFFDPRVIMKKEYLDKNKKKVTGANWYQLEATRAVNQAVGRVIRHRNDYGAILFCDSRFGDSMVKQQMSAWLRPYIQNPAQFGLVTRGLCQFFKFAKEKLPQPKVKLMSEAWGERTDEPVMSRAVSASFDTRSRWLSCDKPAARGHGNFNWNQQASNSPSPLYSQPQPSPKPKPKPMSMFGALEESVEVIDFNSVASIEPQQGSFAVTSKSAEARPPDAKRRKLRVMGVPISYEPTSYESFSANVPKSLESTLLPEASSSKSEASSKESSQNRMVAYLKQVKKSLSKEEMAKFNNAVRLYSATSNFSHLLTTLDNLFGKPHLLSCIQGFAHYIKSAHKDQFAVYCKKKLPNLNEECR